jgi:hypothetical protein
MKKFKIRYEMETVLDVAALWPGGDAPENPTVDDVVRLINKYGGIYRVLDTWNLHQCDSDWSVTDYTTTGAIK